MAKDTKKLVVLVSSPVYGIEELLERIYTLLTTFGYEVWMSHKGTMPVWSSLSAFDNCLRAVKRCDLFLGLITPAYGSGKDASGMSITHRELRAAIELNKPRWLLAHDHVVFARALLDHLGYDSREKRETLKLKTSPVFDDLRVIDMYEDAIRDEERRVEERKGNWVQKFSRGTEAALFTTAQFSRYYEVEEFIKENFPDLEK